MENASKALIMAAEVLIGIVVLGIFSFLFVRMGSISKTIHKNIEADKILIFNNHFDDYSGRIDITANDIVSVINFAKKANKDNEITDLSRSDFVNVIINGKSFFNADVYNNEKSYESAITNFIKENNTVYFSCNAKSSIRGKDIVSKYVDKGDITYDESSGYVNKIIFTTTGNGYNILTKDDYNLVKNGD